MKNELRIFFTALMFYTRIPCPKWVGYSEENLNKATRYFPLIGWLVGLSTAIIIYLFQLFLPITVSVVLGIIVGVLMTGAFHEDGFADVCDGFGGGWTTERILDIMKDSRVGAYALVGFILLITLKIFSFIELLHFNIWFALKAIILAHVLSRFSAIIIMKTRDYARADATSKVKPLAKRLSNRDFIISALFVVPALLLFQNWLIILVLVPTLLMTFYLAYYFQKWIGGYTGDCLGATQQINEVIVLISALALWSFIS